MIKVKGTFKLVGDFEVELDMTEEQFDFLSFRKQNHVLENSIDWLMATRGAELDELEVNELEEIK